MVSQQEASKQPENVVKLQPDDKLFVPLKSEAPCLPQRESPHSPEGSRVYAR